MKLRDLTFQYVEDYMETFGEEPAFLCFLMDMRDDLFRLQFNSVEGMKKQVLLVWREVGKQKGLKNTAPDKVPDSLWTYFVEAKSIKKKATRSKSVSSKSTTVTTTVVSDKSSSGVFDSKVKSIQNFELKPLPSFPAVNGISFHQDLVQYRTTALEKVKTHSFTNQQLLSLSNILLLSQSEPIEFLNPETSSQLYASITTPLFKDVPSFPSIEFSQIKAAFLSFSSNPDTLVFSDAMFTIARNTTDPIVQSLIHSFITLAQEITLPYIQNMSEMRIQTSFIHPLVRGILKHFPSLIPHCSNKFAFVDDHHIMHCWPDYRVDLYNEAGMYDDTNLFGELKPADSKADDVTSDFHKCMCLGKLALKNFKTNYFMTFHSVGSTIHFYLHHSLNPQLSYALHLRSFKIHTTYDTFTNYLSNIPQLYQISQLFRILCLNQPKVLVSSSQTVPYPAIKEAIRSNQLINKKKLVKELSRLSPNP